ncbi:hypothetical protein D3C76_1807680 [compost metagenome]
MNMDGMVMKPMSRFGKRFANASSRPNRKVAPSALHGRHLAKISAASAMKPRPAVISLTNPAEMPVAR